jgi:hypothetical protein
VIIIALLWVNVLRSEGVGRYRWIERPAFARAVAIVVIVSFFVELSYRVVRASQLAPGPAELPYRAFLSASVLLTTFVFLAAARSVRAKMRLMAEGAANVGRRRPGSGSSGGGGSDSSPSRAAQTTVLIAMIAMLGMGAVLVAGTYAAVIAVSSTSKYSYYQVLNTLGQVIKLALQLVILRGVQPPSRRGTGDRPFRQLSNSTDAGIELQDQPGVTRL